MMSPRRSVADAVLRASSPLASLHGPLRRRILSHDSLFSLTPGRVSYTTWSKRILIILIASFAFERTTFWALEYLEEDSGSEWVQGLSGLSNATSRRVAEEKEYVRNRFGRESSIMSKDTCEAAGGVRSSYFKCGSTRYCCEVCKGRKKCDLGGMHLEHCACTAPRVERDLPLRAGRCSTSQGVQDDPMVDVMSTPLYATTPVQTLRCVEPNAYDGAVFWNKESPGGIVVLSAYRSHAGASATQISNLIFTLRLFGFGAHVGVRSLPALSPSTDQPALKRTERALDVFNALDAMPPTKIVLLLDVVYHPEDGDLGSLILGDSNELVKRFKSNRLCHGSRCEVVYAALQPCLEPIERCHDSEALESGAIIGFAGRVHALLHCINSTNQVNHKNWQECAVAAKVKTAVDHKSLFFVSVPNSSSLFRKTWALANDSNIHFQKLVGTGVLNGAKPIVALFRGLRVDRSASVRSGRQPTCRAVQEDVYNLLGTSLHRAHQATVRVVVTLSIPLTRLNDAVDTILLLAHNQSMIPNLVYVGVIAVKEQFLMTKLPHSLVSHPLIKIGQIDDIEATALLSLPLSEEHDASTLIITAESGVAYSKSFVETLYRAHLAAPGVALGFGGAMLDMAQCQLAKTLNVSQGIYNVDSASIRSTDEWSHAHVAVDILSFHRGGAFALRYVKSSVFDHLQSYSCDSFDGHLSAHFARLGVPRIKLPDGVSRLHSSVEQATSDLGLLRCMVKNVHAVMKSRTPLPQPCPVLFQRIGLRTRDSVGDSSLTACSAKEVHDSTKSSKFGRRTRLVVGESMVTGDVLVSPDRTVSAIVASDGLCVRRGKNEPTPLFCFPGTQKPAQNMPSFDLVNVSFDGNKLCIFRAGENVDIECTPILQVSARTAHQPGLSLGVSDDGVLHITAGNSVRLWAMNKPDAQTFARRRALGEWDSRSCRSILPTSNCFKVDAQSVFEDRCKSFTKGRSLLGPKCSVRRVPRVYHVMVEADRVPTSVTTNLKRNPGYRLHVVNKSAANVYIQEHCGKAAAKATQKGLASHIFRFCALATEGGVYVDSDLHMMASLDHAYSSCSHTSMGYLYSNMPQEFNNVSDTFLLTAKIVAGTPNSKIHKCMLKRLIQDKGVLGRKGDVDMIISKHLSHCLSNCIRAAECHLNEVHTPTSVAISYRSNALASWPYTGIIGHVNSQIALLAFEEPKPSDFGYTKDSE